MWEEAATASLPAFQTPEILAADLSGLVLDLAAWGVAELASLHWLDPPPAPALIEARKHLAELGALDHAGRITPLGQSIRKLPLPPRLAAMVLNAAEQGEARHAAEIAVVLVERGLGGDGTDVAHRVDQFRRDKSRRGEDARRLAENWAREAEKLAPKKQSAEMSAGLLLALAYRDRVAQARGKPGEFRLMNGRGARVEPHDALAREPYLAIADLAGAAGSARIRLAAAISHEEIERLFAREITSSEDVAFDPQSVSVRARKVERLGALVLSEAPLPTPRNDATAHALAEGVGKLGSARLPWTKAVSQWRERVGFLRRAEGEAWPDLSDDTLAKNAAEWLAPFLSGKASLSEIGADDLAAALKSLLPYDLARRMDKEAPTHFTAPTGSNLAVDYSGAEPMISVRVQELFGLDTHPSLAGGKVPLVLELLSPAHRPIQVTRDLPGFWSGSWRDVRADMRGRYPRHSWPENPRVAEATRRAKPRGT
jgi:ATP-dependent helicase HrpB